MERIEEFTIEGRQFIYFDLSQFKSNDEFRELIEASKSVMTKYPEQSLYTITNVEGVVFDSVTKEIVAGWTTHNKPYVKYGVVIGIDGIKKIMINAIFKLSRRYNITFKSDKDQAIAWLLDRD